MSNRYGSMTSAELLAEMEAWESLIRIPKGPGGPSNAARDAAEQQLALAEAWYHRVLRGKETT